MVQLRLCVDALRATGAVSDSKLARLSSGIAALADLADIQNGMHQVPLPPDVLPMLLVQLFLWLGMEGAWMSPDMSMFLLERGCQRGCWWGLGKRGQRGLVPWCDQASFER